MIKSLWQTRDDFELLLCDIWMSPLATMNIFSPLIMTELVGCDQNCVSVLDEKVYFFQKLVQIVLVQETLDSFETLLVLE